MLRHCAFLFSVFRKLKNNRPMDIKLVLVTCPTSDKAHEIAEALIASGSAACVNIIPSLTSIYRWEGKTERDSEVMLLIKSRASRLAALEKTVIEMHPYSTPEFIVIDTESVSERYAQWVREVTS
jgi:periplasmic divalent cation tolerance protein